MPTPVGRVLIIAGSDSGGGAGIQGDSKTVTCLGGYAMTALTALTAQNTQGVFGIHPIPEAFIAQQIELCLTDIGADAIKTGMLHSASVIETVVSVIKAQPMGSLTHRGRVRVGAELARDFPQEKTLEHAHSLRKRLTDCETKLWYRLNRDQLGVRFRRQHPIGPYIADFACLDPKLIIELDGSQHADAAAQIKDSARTLFLESQGFSVLRFWNSDVIENIDGVVSVITEALCQASPHPNPPPAGEGTQPPCPYHLVVDPVMVAKGGAALLQKEALQALKTKLIPLATIITPNLPEAELLLGRKIEDATAMQAAAEDLLELGCQAVLLKGGHGEGNTITDSLISRDGIRITLTSERIETRHTHGTGCTLASAIATGLAQGMGLEAAVRRAHAYVRQAIENAPGFGKGHGPLGHFLGV